MEKNKEINRFYVLFKEKMKVFEEQNIRFNTDSAWLVTIDGEIVVKNHFFGAETYDYRKRHSGFSVMLPGIHNIKKSDFESLLNLESLNGTGLITNMILAREVNTITERSISTIKNWLDSFPNIETNLNGIRMPLQEKYLREGLLELRFGHKKMYLPSGRAAETILTLGNNRFLNLKEARRLVKQINIKDARYEIERS